MRQLLLYSNTFYRKQGSHLVYSLMWEKTCHKPPMTGNGNHTTYKNGDDWGMVSDCLPTLQPTKKLIEYRIKSPLIPITIFKQSYGPKYQLSILSVCPTF